MEKAENYVTQKRCKSSIGSLFCVSCYVKIFNRVKAFGSKVNQLKL